MSATLDTRPIETEAQSALATTAGLVVVDVASYELAGRELLTLASAERRVADWFTPLKSAAHKAWKLLCDREREVLAPVQREIVRLKNARTTWKAAEDAARRREEARLAEIARQAEQERLAQAAAALEARGQVQQAAQILDRALTAPAPPVVIPDPTPRTAGISQRLVWKWRVVDEALVPPEYKKLDDVKIGAYARAMKSTGSIPGIEIYSETDESVRRSA